MYSSQQDHGIRYPTAAQTQNPPPQSFLPPRSSLHTAPSSRTESPTQQSFNHSPTTSSHAQATQNTSASLHPRLPPLGLNTAQIGEVHGAPPSVVSPTTALVSQGLQPSQPWSISSSINGKTYRLEVAQQPVRARMCGFGDKDRRPITPPPCIRLVITDEKTGKEIDMNELEANYHVLTADLWSTDGKKELNMVRHSLNSPSISATSTTSFPPPPVTQPNVYAGSVIPINGSGPAYPPQSYPQSQYQQGNGYAPAYQAQQQPPSQQMSYVPPGHPHHHYLQNQQNGYYNQQPGSQPQSSAPLYYYQHNTGSLPPTSPTHSGPMGMDPHTNGMYTRNLIGSLCSNAFKLKDPEERMGEWFILQDLSVRTEGTFRLKFNFVNIIDKNNPHQVNHGACPILASIFSDEFTVFSAKKFPGVIESTSISKCFAGQGIKIPIRKDGPRGNQRENSNDNDDE